MLAPINSRLEEIVTEESIITHLTDLEKALLGKIVEQKREIDALKFENQLLTGRVAILENTMTERLMILNNMSVCLCVEDMQTCQPGLISDLEVLSPKVFRTAKNFLGPLSRGSGYMLPQKILKISVLRLAESAFPTF